MASRHLLLGWLLFASPRLAAQDPTCDYDKATLQRASPYCLDTSYVKADSLLRAAYQRALASLTDPPKRAALARSQQAWAGYLAAQETLFFMLPGKIRSNYALAHEVRQRRFFLQRVLLGEWTELDELAAQVLMRSSLRNLINAEEQFFTDSAKYSARIGPGGVTYHPEPQTRILSLRLTNNGWAATMGHVSTNTTCAVFIGSTPSAPAVKEGVPACQ